MRLRQAVSIATLTLAVTACFKHKQDSDPQSFEPVVVQVENHNWSDIVVYALVGGTRHRLGSVATSNHATLKVPETLMPMPGTIELVLDPLGSRTTFRTGSINVGSGQEVRLVVENELRLTNWRVQ